jgi:hypothetical protein
MQIPCVYLPGPAPAVTVANSNKIYIQDMANSFTFVTILLQHRPSIHVAIKLLNNSLLCYVYTYVTFDLSFYCNYVPCCSPSAIVLYSASLVLGIFLIILKIQFIYVRYPL